MKVLYGCDTSSSDTQFTSLDPVSIGLMILFEKGKLPLDHNPGDGFTYGLNPDINKRFRVFVYQALNDNVNQVSAR